MHINDLDRSLGYEEYYTDDFIQNIESHLTLFRENIRDSLTISKHQSYKYEGDLYGLLKDLGIESRYHYTIMRINGYESSLQYNGKTEFLNTIDYSMVDQIVTLLETKK